MRSARRRDRFLSHRTPEIVKVDLD